MPAWPHWIIPPHLLLLSRLLNQHETEMKGNQELGSITLTLSSLPLCSPMWLSTVEVQPRLGQLPGRLLQALLHPEELGGCRDTVQALRGAPGHHPDPRRAGLHQRYVTCAASLHPCPGTLSAGLQVLNR